MAKKDKRWFAVIDGVEGKGYDDLISGSRIVFNSHDMLLYIAIRGNDIYLVEEKLKKQAG